MIATSIGIALYPDDADERALLLNYADTALYKANTKLDRDHDGIACE